MFQAKSNQKCKSELGIIVYHMLTFKFTCYVLSFIPVFLNLFWFAAPFLGYGAIGRHPLIQFTSIQTTSSEIGGTPRIFSGHPSVPQHPGWEPLSYTQLEWYTVMISLIVCNLKSHVIYFLHLRTTSLIWFKIIKSVVFSKIRGT